MAECIYFSYEHTTPWHSDVFDHPDYEYYCVRNTKKKEIFSWTCSKCPYYKEEKLNDKTENSYLVSTL